MSVASKIKVATFFTLGFCLVVSLYLVVTVEQPKVTFSLEALVPNDNTKHRSYSNDPLLYAISASSTYSQKYSDFVIGGIVSHHLLANIDISHFFYEFTDQKVDRVVILGPNHYYPNAFPFLSTNRNYTTPFGDVSIDKKVVTDLVSGNLAELSPATLEEEHSISSLVPYVSAYFPEAEIVPIIISASASKSELQRLSDFLVKQKMLNTVVVASVDFSHHLYSNASQLHDVRTISALKNFDYDSILNSEVDSPGSLFVLLKYLEAKEAKNISLKQQSSANIFDNYDSEDVTSYVFAHAHKGVSSKSQGVSVLFFGDTMLGRGIAENKNLFSSIRGPEGNFLKGYDGIMVNLEGAVKREGCDIEDDELLIMPDDLSLLSQNRISHVGIMNNHFGRCKDNNSVKSIFQNYNLIPVSDTKTTIKGTNLDMELVSFFASPVPSDYSAMVNRAKELSGKSSKVVVNIHWGVEYDDEPSMKEKELARALIDAGADLIIGHHPHVVQPVEVYKDGLIFYSLGNFISDQLGQKTQEGFAVGLFSTSKSIQATIFPFFQQNGIPVHFEQFKAREFCNQIFRGDDSLKSPDHPCIITLFDENQEKN